MAYHHIPLYDLLNHTWTAHPAFFAPFCPRYCCFYTTRSSISHLLRHWPYFLCHPLSGVCAPRRFATPGLARWWVPRAVAHIHCPGNILAPRCSPCSKGWCPGYQFRCLFPSRRLGPPEASASLSLGNISCVGFLLSTNTRSHGCADTLYHCACLLSTCLR